MLFFPLIISMFLAANMGISGFSVSFAPSYGSAILRKNAAVILYTIGIVIGGLTLGPRVVETLTHKIAAQNLSGHSPLLIVIACTLTMFVSNVLKVPQSTSFVTVASFTGAGLYFGEVNWPMIVRILGFAIFFSLTAFVTVWLCKKAVYPPRQGNLKFYTLVFSKRKGFRRFIIGHDIYAAFSVGTNNVANVVAPLAILSAFKAPALFLIMGPFFGIGAFIAGERVIKAISKDIVPVGEFSASLVSSVTATLVIIASALGLPTPYAQITTFSLMGVSCSKDGFKRTFAKDSVQRILWVWFLGPLVTTGFTYYLHLLFME